MYLMETLEHSAIWYTYALIDPRTSAAFYIGKGKGARLLAHEKQAALGVCSEKCFRIKEIWSAGFEVERRFLAFFWDERAALEHERDVVAEIGLANLTNMCDGGGVPSNPKWQHPTASAPLSLAEQIGCATEHCIWRLALAAVFGVRAKFKTNWDNAIHGMAITMVDCLRNNDVAWFRFKQRLLDSYGLEVG